MPQYILPNVKAGGGSPIEAASLEEAKQKAMAQGWYEPSAGTFGLNSLPEAERNRAFGGPAAAPPQPEYTLPVSSPAFRPSTQPTSAEIVQQAAASGAIPSGPGGSFVVPIARLVAQGVSLAEAVRRVQGEERPGKAPYPRIAEPYVPPGPVPPAPGPVQAPSDPYGLTLQARDGQTLGGQSPATQQLFKLAFGLDAGKEWVRQHNAELDQAAAAPPPVVPTVPAAPVAPGGGGGGVPSGSPADGSPAAATGSTVGTTVGSVTAQLGRTYAIAGLQLPLVAWLALGYVGIKVAAGSGGRRR